MGFEGEKSRSTGEWGLTRNDYGRVPEAHHQDTKYTKDRKGFITHVSALSITIYLLSHGGRSALIAPLTHSYSFEF